ncbi:MAPEG family protein [Alteraurantiacibacter aquimixticola]|uniref:MAPEG family protein n=1 Tax=Alteraurantiacibacter aquimixticola TaxID=2489173 RepID=A0A4V4U9G4_9SPHN|nr:MAPEG family protein [Alteraurantiacibacter aquimixticola]TIX51997.1 MAPEG family protein [Alteraurantiacibacter aquimixticola]
MQMEILAPAAVLVAWSIVMLVWMAATRLPALAKLNLPPERTRGGRGSDLDGVIPDNIQWKAHNYNHLMEQPTIFYALVAIFAIGGATQTDVWLAWAYVAIRLVHSFWQALVNTIPVRIALFTISSIVLGVMAVRAVILTLG